MRCMNRAHLLGQEEVLMSCRILNLNNASWFVVTGVFSLFLTSAALAQQNPTGPPPGAGPPMNKNPNLDDRVRQVDEGRLRTAEMDASAEEVNQKRLQAAIVNMKQDFTRIQVLRNDIARNLVAHKPLDYSLITEQTAEINKRAHRLNLYMLARAPENKEQSSASDLKSEEMIGALVKLCKLIDSFTENPALKNVATIDAKEIEKAKQDKAKADGDLLAIIKLSGSIHRESDSLKP
jgi:hypothetical protein